MYVFIYFFLLQVDKPKRDEESSARNLFESTQKIRAEESTDDQSKNDIKKIIMKPKTLRLQNPNVTAGRFKKVQFNTLPEFSTQKNRKGVMFLAEFSKEPSLDSLPQARKTNDSDEKLPLFRDDDRVYLEKGKCIIWYHTIGM